ncbi:hypothetical protein BP00DRAFT_261822 [Aspergillus indologenus CBS 114.80]|uniref:Uncharacterized protein n=1 Tax=Aspergillus indologenus CBS 114.80 TaxID=1450541 RepID=A0A2V5J3P2_9EURO|nr:hypothetical protein BP00DRAFT_261822 [Aspergillus indologenus CBS 114.80]
MFRVFSNWFIDSHAVNRFLAQGKAVTLEALGAITLSPLKFMTSFTHFELGREQGDESFAGSALRQWEKATGPFGASPGFPILPYVFPFFAGPRSPRLIFRIRGT